MSATPPESPLVELLHLWPSLDAAERRCLLWIAVSHWHPIRLWLFRFPAPHVIGAR